MTPQERNALVASVVFGWQPHECDGEIGEKPISPDGWFCQTCGFEGSWGGSTLHEQIPPRYTENLSLAHDATEKTMAMLHIENLGEGFPGHPLYPRFTTSYSLGKYSLTLDYTDAQMVSHRFSCDNVESEGVPRAICWLLLQALNAPDEEMEAWEEEGKEA
jgi:hypothetical protein